MITKLLSALVALTSFAIAQNIEQLSAEQAGKIARKVTASLGTPADAPFAVDPDVEKPAGIKGSGEVGLLALPDRKLTPAALASVGKETAALGHLWMRNVVPAASGSAPEPAKLRTVAVSDNDKEVKVEVYYLGVAKTDDGTLELGIYGKEKEPLVKVPLVKTNAAESSTPIALDGHKEGENTGLLVITVFGSYKADVTVTKPRE
jgi:hypothetical protein